MQVIGLRKEFQKRLRKNEKKVKKFVKLKTDKTFAYNIV